MASLKALTFLGTGNYQEVTYIWDEKSCKTAFFPEAIAHIFDPEAFILFVTEGAKNHDNFRELHSRLGDRLKPVDIPSGKSEADLWEIFDRVAQSVEEGDTVILDITHALRSIPMIVFAVAAYLRRTKGVTVRHIIYGAYEARKPFREPPQPEDQAPVFDLTPLLDLLDWLSGAEFLLRRSNATLLAERLEQVHQQAWQTRAGNNLPKRLQSVAGKLRLFSQAMHLAHPRYVMQYAKELKTMLEEVAAEAEQWAKPFAVILGQVRSEVAKFAHDTPERLDRENLQKQLTLVKHLDEKELWMQAIMLAREWVVSWGALQKGMVDWLDKNDREQQIEQALGAAVQRLQGKSVEVPEWFEALPQSSEVAKVWNKLAQLRNEVAHCGMRQQPTHIQRIEQRLKEILQHLEMLMKDVPDQALYGGQVVIDLKDLYGEVAKLDELSVYLERAKELAGEGNEVVLTGQAPVWLYLAIAHALHGKARRLLYTSPAAGEVCIFDHTSG